MCCEKIYIIGIVASGKSTLARLMEKKLDIPHHEVDVIVHGEKGELAHRRMPAQQLEMIQRIDSEGGWIIEGTYRPSCHCLLDMADVIVFLDPPLRVRKRRILTRFLKQQLRIESCRYESNIGMLRDMYRWTNDFERDRPKFEAMLSIYETKLIRATSTADALDKLLSNRDQR